MSKRKRTDSTASDDKAATEPTKILDLNEDCVLQIFSFLPTIDLCAVKTTCQRFETLANDHFVTRYRHHPVNFGPKFGDLAERGDFSDGLKVLRHFGGVIRALSVHCITEDDDSYHWGDILDCCTGLTELNLFGCVLRYLIYYRRRSDTMHSLALNKCHGSDDDFTNTIYSFGNLKRLTVEYGFLGVKTGFLRRRIPSLEDIIIRSTPSSANSVNTVLPLFIAANPQLKRIHCNFNYVKCDILDSIATHSRALESLALQLYDTYRAPFPEDIAKLNRLQHLRVLEISCAAYKNGINAALEALAKPNILHTLSISDTKFDIESSLALMPLTNLNTLKLVKMNIGSGFVVMLKRFLNLEHLHVICCRGVEYKQMVTVIEPSKSLKSLTYSCDCSCDLEIDHKLYAELIDARKSSGASITLNIFLPGVVMKKLEKKVREAMTSTSCVQLRKMDVKTKYVHAFFINDENE